ncbi:hypothetical protein BN85309420 [Paracholeplasma brassicae]|uniref:Uncharacterized protein n=1 Tax=Acholeplasma brassicae TaxID=61635 RepID=U4KRQ9_9MOLU|nr:hypothetical protein [Paracholeplasma brassicae]CCV65963.1 hypothetical protein BN85309420 [Paracholeplasma brassicae]
MRRNQSNRLFFLTIGLFILTLGLFTSVVFAWISQSRNASVSPFVASVKDLAIDFDFYRYNDEDTFDGSSSYTLENNTCNNTTFCYDFLENPTASAVIPQKLKPSDKLSFAITISNRSTTDTTLDLKLNGVMSLGFNQINNQIQRAFKYEVKAVKYLNNSVESADQKTLFSYANTYFVPEVSNYTLIDDVSLAKQNDANSVVIIFFDLYFDPSIGSYDTNNVLQNNSNAFMNQVFKIDQLLIDYED